MAIRFKCPNPGCQKALSVKDEAAGKKLACPICKKSFTVPVPRAAPGPAPKPAAPVPTAADLEDIAAAALAGGPGDGAAKAAAGPAKEAGTIDFTCDYCDTALHLPAEMAGKK